MNLFALTILLGIGVLFVIGTGLVLSVSGLADLFRRLLRWRRAKGRRLDDLLDTVFRKNEAAALRLRGHSLEFERLS